MAPIQSIISGLKAAHPSLLVSLAPQMTDLFPDYPQVAGSWNRYAPLVNNSFLAGHIDFVWPQMYNTWGGVETIAYAKTYAGEIAAGFTLTGTGGATYAVNLPMKGFFLGYPASPSGAGSGFIDPAAVVAMVHALQANNTNLGGLMDWDLGWDQKSGWAFADAVAAG